MINKVRENVVASGTPLFADLYHLTMAQAWFLDKKADEIKTSEAFFRKCPFGGSYLMAAGLHEFAQWLNNWHFSDDDIQYLREQKNADGSNKFNDDFLNYIKSQKLKLSIKAVREGEIVFPNEPIYSISGPSWQVEIVEAALLNIFNSQQQNYQLFKKLNTIWVFNESQGGQSGGGTGWMVLKCYLDAKLAWNVNYDYNELIKKFFANYFGGFLRAACP
jgi:nicotinic acid phosphoribosyltransferase